MKNLMKLLLLFLFVTLLEAEDGHQLWLRSQTAKPVKIVCPRQSVTLDIARQELEQGWQGNPGTEVILTVKYDKSLKGDGFILNPSGVQANTDLGILYGVFDLLRRQKTGQPVKDITSNPS
ncbi:MAG: alpha-glucuronidase, partial [Calditrichota bacterium]